MPDQADLKLATPSGYNLPGVSPQGHPSDLPAGDLKRHPQKIKYNHRTYIIKFEHLGETVNPIDPTLCEQIAIELGHIISVMQHQCDTEIKDLNDASLIQDADGNLQFRWKKHVIDITDQLELIDKYKKEDQQTVKKVHEKAMDKLEVKSIALSQTDEMPPATSEIQVIPFKDLTRTTQNAYPKKRNSTSTSTPSSPTQDTQKPTDASKPGNSKQPQSPKPEEKAPEDHEPIERERLENEENTERRKLQEALMQATSKTPKTHEKHTFMGHEFDFTPEEMKLEGIPAIDESHPTEKDGVPDWVCYLTTGNTDDRSQKDLAIPFLAELFRANKETSSTVIPFGEISTGESTITIKEDEAKNMLKYFILLMARLAQSCNATNPTQSFDAEFRHFTSHSIDKIKQKVPNIHFLSKDYFKEILSFYNKHFKS